MRKQQRPSLMCHSIDDALSREVRAVDDGGVVDYPQLVTVYVCTTVYAYICSAAALKTTLKSFISRCEDTNTITRTYPSMLYPKGD
ncbi:hypothetical protein DM02DRAFT_149383 [Periconia macrospinosa]|uniref:Uncharacterized protein n=1 Tax=Periconia macrospinosa TaxID=97972 RepID=A0A2V1DE03_9PLEO|nr:hypothetical protein DM02DRAFT_149383 [Periconia macrospinosa]